MHKTAIPRISANYGIPSVRPILSITPAIRGMKAPWFHSLMVRSIVKPLEVLLVLRRDYQLHWHFARLALLVAKQIRQFMAHQGVVILVTI